MNQVLSPRRSSAYSLDEAARIRQAMGSRRVGVECPRCGLPLDQTVGSDGTQLVRLVRCASCERSLVIRG